VNFSALSMGSAMCMGRFDYVDQMLFETLVPVAMVAILKGVSVVHLAFFAPDDAALRAKVTIHAWVALHAAGGNTHVHLPSVPPFVLRQIIGSYFTIAFLISYLVLPNITTKVTTPPHIPIATCANRAHTL
jgi:hypothetical protein